MRVGLGLFFFVAASLTGQVLPLGSIPVSPGAFTLLHVTAPAGTAACSPTCTVTVTSTTAGTLQVLMAATSDGNQAWVNAVSGAGNWSCPLMDNLPGIGSISGCYNLSSTAGVTSLTLTSTVSGDSYNVRQFEYSFTGGPASLDSIGTTANLTASTTAAGIALTLGGARDVIVQSIVSTNGPTAISGGYGNFAAQASYGGWADLENTTNGAAPNWTLPSSQTSLVGAMSFRLGSRNFTIVPTTCVGDQNGTLSGSISCTWSPFNPAAGSSLVCGGVTWNGGSAVTGLSISDGTVFTNSQAARDYSANNHWILLSYRFNIGVTAPATITLTITGTDMFANIVCNSFTDNIGTPTADGTCTFGTSNSPATPPPLACTAAIVTTGADYVANFSVTTNAFPTFNHEGWAMGAHVKGAALGVQLQNAAGSITPQFDASTGSNSGINGFAIKP